MLPDITPLWFDQDPALLTADYSGPVTLRNFLVTGDVETIQFKPVVGDIETWTRTGVTEIGTRRLSVFSPSWDQHRVSAALQEQEVGFDYPYVYWGQVLPPGAAEGSRYGVNLRWLSNAIPSVTVIRAADDVQFSSAIVNVRADDFGNTQLLNDENQYGFDKITKRFGITTASGRVTTPMLNAFHQRVRNDVKGIGLPIFDNSILYGSETAHRWGAFIDWAKLTGITMAGHQPTSHDPLMTGGETRLGAVLEGTRRVENVNGAWTIQRTPAPILFHPYMLYAMGLLAAEAVPEVSVFEDQAQFNPTSIATPSVGTVIDRPDARDSARAIANRFASRCRSTHRGCCRRTFATSCRTRPWRRFMTSASACISPDSSRRPTTTMSTT